MYHGSGARQISLSQVAASMHDNTLRQVRRVAEKARRKDPASAVCCWLRYFVLGDGKSTWWWWSWSWSWSWWSWWWGGGWWWWRWRWWWWWWAHNCFWNILCSYEPDENGISNVDMFDWWFRAASVGFVEEEETEADVLGLLEFRECEMRQLELSLGESVTWFKTLGGHWMALPLLAFNLLIRCCICCAWAITSLRLYVWSFETHQKSRGLNCKATLYFGNVFDSTHGVPSLP